MITWTDDTGGSALDNTDPTPYESRELAAQEGRRLYPGKKLKVVPYPESSIADSERD
jgi:hypothetical protein